MKLKQLGIGSLSLMMAAYAGIASANEILLTANQPTSITYKIAHKNMGAETVFSELKYADLSRNVNVPIKLGDYERAGIVVISIDGHDLPSSTNQFDKPAQCSITTDKTKATAALELQLFPHKANCRTYGGVFG